MDPEVRAQVQSNIHVIYEPAVASHVHIATCRGTDNTFMAFLVMHGNLLKTVWNPNLLAGDARPTRAAAMLSLLEATEDRIRDMLLKSNFSKSSSKKSGKENSKQRTPDAPFKEKEERGRSMPPRSNTTTTSSTSATSLSENASSLDYSVRPTKELSKERSSFLPWRRTSAAVAATIRSESVYTQT